MIKKIGPFIQGFVLALIVASGTLVAAGVTRISFGSSLPTNCASGNIFIKTSATAGPYWCSSAGSPGTWTLVSSSATGDVVGPSSAVNNQIAVFDTTTGKLIKDGGQTIAQVISAASGSAAAGGSDKQIQYNNTGVLGGISPSTAGFVLTSNGTSSTPSFQAASSGALVLLEQHTASSSSSLDFTAWYSSTYDEYQVSMVNLVPAGNTEVLIRFSTNGGSSYDSGSNYATANAGGFPVATSFGGGSNSTTSLSLRIGTNTTLPSNVSFNGRFTIYNPGGALYKFVVGQQSWYDNSLGIVISSLGGVYKNTSAVNAFQIVMASGNITSGTIRVYGVAK